MLSNYGFHDLAWKTASQTSYPSWGYMVEKGATTIWELWNSDTEGPGMNSRNHFALGSCGEWYYSHLAGIRPETEAPGFKKIILAPMPPEGLDWAKASLNTVYGRVSSQWRKHNNSVEFEFEIPANTTAEFHAPSLGKKIKFISEGKVVVYEDDQFMSTENMTLLKTSAKETVISLNAGVYQFVVAFE